MRARIVGIAALLACHAPPPSSMAATAMPDIPVYELVQPSTGAGLSVERATRRDPLAEIGTTRRVTLNANNADARALLLWLARQSGVSIVVAPDVAARVSVSFTDAPAGDAMRAIMAQAGLSILAPAPQTPWPPVVFYQVPMNVNAATADVIAARFGVSAEMARWIVESRARPD